MKRISHFYGDEKFVACRPSLQKISGSKIHNLSAIDKQARPTLAQKISLLLAAASLLSYAEGCPPQRAMVTCRLGDAAAHGLAFASIRKWAVMKSNLRNHKIRHLRLSPATCVSEHSLVEDAIRQMQTQRVGCVLVCRNNRIVGIMTEVDVVRKAELGKDAMRQPIHQWMTPAPISISADSSIWDAAKAMKDGGFRHLPVIDFEGAPIGFISIRNIVTYLADQFPDTIYTLPPDPDKVPGTAEGA